MDTDDMTTTMPRTRFSQEEDDMLAELVKKFGPRHWDTIAKKLAGRTGRQCRDRYTNYLNPDINKKKWSHAEDNLLYRKYLEIGPKWSKISRFFTGRTGAALKNRWNYKLSFKYSPEYGNSRQKKAIEQEQPIVIKTDDSPEINVGFVLSEDEASEITITMEPRIRDLFADFEFEDNSFLFFGETKMK